MSDRVETLFHQASDLRQDLVHARHRAARVCAGGSDQEMPAPGLRALLADAPPAEIVKNPKVVEAYLGSANAAP